MQQIFSIRELQAVINGGLTFLYESFYKDKKVICHPIAPVTFLPANIESATLPVEGVGIDVGWVLIYSIDGYEWISDPGEVIAQVMRTGDDFYISDWKLNILFVVEPHRLEYILELLTMTVEEFRLIRDYKWKPTEVGSLQSYRVEEYFSE